MSSIVLAAAGRRIDAEGTPEECVRFPASLEPRVAREVRHALGELAPRAVIASLACGADILVHEAARDLGIRRRVILPFAREEFRRRSVTDRGEAWGKRFDELLSGTDVVQLADGTPDDDAAAERAYSEVTYALVRVADEGARGTGGTRGALIVWDEIRHGLSDQTALFRNLTDMPGWSRREISTR